MCTVTWLREGDSYSVFFNRDELKTRARALPPACKMQNGVRYLAPVDPDGGGTWLGANHFGLTCGVLNNYAITKVRSRSFRSRGLLVPALLDCASPFAALTKLRTLPLDDFRPFFLILFTPRQSQILGTWNGDTLHIDENVRLPLSSSSFDTDRVVKNRRNEFAVLCARRPFPDKKLLAAYHASHSAKGGAYSVCMHREDAGTVSFSQINVTPALVEFLYTPGAPCQTAERRMATLQRVC